MMDEAIKKIRKELEFQARGLRIPEAAADEFIKITLDAVYKDLVGRKIITVDDIKRRVVKELKKYNKDFAYVYENYDIII